MTGSSLKCFQARIPRESEPEIGSGGSVLAQDIPDTCLTTSRTDVSRHRRQPVEPRACRTPGHQRARLVITAILLEKRTVTEVVADYGVSRSWVYELLARYRAEGEAAFEPRSRRPLTSPHATPTATVELIVRLRKQLREAGLDSGAETIEWHLMHRHQITVSRATIHRILTRSGAVTPEPSKRPKSSYLRFEAAMPNETWQSDFTHYRLTDPMGSPGADVEIITWLDDHSRYALHVSAHRPVTGRTVLETFRQAADLHGYPASTLTDNGMVYTVRLAGHGRQGGKNAFEAELGRLDIVQKNSRPSRPTTCGKSRDSSRP
jgi:transposase InsO family protein